jgi:hypothetical protein
MDATPEDCAELIAIAQEIAELKDCREDESNCDWDSGPRCNTHGDNFWHEDLIKRARAVLAKIEAQHVPQASPFLQLHALMNMAASPQGDGAGE